mgnify:CR=1 FL=1
MTCIASCCYVLATNGLSYFAQLASSLHELVLLDWLMKEEKLLWNSRIAATWLIMCIGVSFKFLRPSWFIRKVRGTGLLIRFVARFFMPILV